MQVKNKNLLITLFSLFFCLLAVMTSLWTTPVKVFAEETEDEYVWVDLKVGDTIANKKLRIHGNAGAFVGVPSSSVIFILGEDLKFTHGEIDPLMLEYTGSSSYSVESNVSTFAHCEKIEDDPNTESGGIWEYSFPSGINVWDSSPDVNATVFLSFEGLKVTYVQTENTDYGVKIQVLMDKEEAVASGRYKIPGDFTLWGITVPVFGAGVVAIVCLVAMNKVKKAKRSKVYRGN